MAIGFEKNSTDLETNFAVFLVGIDGFKYLSFMDELMHNS